MRSLVSSLLSLATVAFTFASAGPVTKKGSTDDDSWDAKVPDTIFNGQTVPPLTELTPNTIESAISKGNWLVEFFSPSCPHCMHFKPTYQTAYEFYYTSKPLIATDPSAPDSLNSFTRYYDFKFAKVDCRAFADLCVDREIQSYPSMVYYEDGKKVDLHKGAMDMKGLSKWIEELLEKIRPGSRKEGGPKLPEPGASSVKTGPDTKEEVKQEEKEKAKGTAASSVASTPTKAAKPSKVKAKATSTPNLSGTVEVLTGESFQKRVTDSLDPWFIKFYAPWCHHCQALAPTWANMARQLQGKLNIGQVDCDVEKKLCRDAGVQGYPTMLFYRGAERIEYDGMRGLGDLLDYAEKALAVSAGIPDVDAAELEKLEEKEDVIFTYFYDHATTSEDFQALERLPLNLVGHAKLVKTNDATIAKRFKINTWPRLAVLRSGKATYYPPITPREMRDVKKMLAWMRSVWLPLVPELTSSNAKDIMDTKLVVLAILTRDRADAFTHARRELKSAALEWIDKQETAFRLERQELRDAKQLSIEEAEDKNDERALRNAKLIKVDMDEQMKGRKQIGFAWVDGIFWERWVRTTYGVDVKEGEYVVINDEANHRYWDTLPSGSPILPSRTSILDALTRISTNPYSIPPKSTSGAFMTAYRTLTSFVFSHSFLALGLVVGSVTATVLFGRRRRRRGGFASSGGGWAEKEGILSGGGFGGNGAKHD